MAAAQSDLLKKTGASTVTTLSAPGKALAATSINVGSTTNYPTDTGIVIAIRQVDSNGDLVAGTYTEWSATVASATSLSIVAAPVYGSDQIYSAGSTTQVYIPLSSYAHNKLIDNILEHANQDGTLITQAVRDALNLDSGSSDGWTPFGYSLTSITALGNRSYTAVVSGTDTTGVTSVGMRLKLPRTVTAPTGSITLNGTTQYANKTSPAGMTFTNNWVASAWVNIPAYADSAFMSRWDGTNGFIGKITTAGQITLTGFNGSAANLFAVSSYQSIPLNKWVHIAIQMDMTVTTNSSTTNYIMIDGKDVPAYCTRAGTNPTSLNQGTASFVVGAQGTTTAFYNGKIAQVAIYSAKVTQATILASMNQTLTGSETSLISAYKLDQASGLTDLAATGNTLTATGSPTYSTTQTPFTNPVTGTSVTAGTTNYGIIMAQTFSTNTTYTIQIPEGETLPTTGGIGTVSYSTQKTPYGFPPMSRLLTNIIMMATYTTSGAGATDVPGMTTTITAPTNEQIRIRFYMPLMSTSAGTGQAISASIFEGATELTRAQATTAGSSYSYQLCPEIILTPTSGSHTYKVSIAAQSGTGTITASTTFPAFLTVELLGGYL